MIYGLYLSTAGAKAQSWRQDVISNNIANADSAGFRRQYALLQQRPSHAAEFGLGRPGGPADPNRLDGGINLQRTPTDLATPGPYETTSRPLDLAIVGTGFFQVKTKSQMLLTRDGSFTVNANGEMTTSDGRGLVMSDQGQPIKVDPNLPIAVRDNGDIIQANTTVAKLAIRAPQNPASVLRMGANGYQFDGPLNPAPGRVQQSTLEGSNVNPIQEMTALIEAARAFETNMSMIQLQSDGLRTLVENIPRV